MASTSIPPLPQISIDEAEKLDIPSLKIRSEHDVSAWKSTKGYNNYMLFLHRLSESVVGYNLPQHNEERQPTSPPIISMLDLLDKLDSWIDQIPPLPTPQRFGNLAFRTWGKILEDNAEDLFKSLLPSQLHGCIHLLIPYLIISFGSFTRMDYGTGHEAAFGLLLLCLTLIRFFEPVPEEERALVLVVFERYLRLCWRLQDVYRLEPAGSQGVWGLDDYSFLGYIFGSAQLRGQRDIPVSAILRAPLPPLNFYFLQISRIHEFKHGPFHEHSSQLYSIATGVPKWAKVHSGLFKMYEAEVLGKRVVVQHTPVGGLLDWNPPASAANPVTTMTPAPWLPSTTGSNAVHTFSASGTSAPWTSALAESHRAPALPSSSMTQSTGAPWATNHARPSRP